MDDGRIKVNAETETTGKKEERRGETTDEAEERRGERNSIHVTATTST